MKRSFAFLSILALSLALIPSTAVAISPPITPIDKLWALIIRGYPSEMRPDPEYLRDVLVNHYQFSGIYFKGSLGFPGRDYIKQAIANIPSDSDDLVFIFIMSHGVGMDNGRVDGSEGDPVDEADGIDEGLILEEGYPGHVTTSLYWDDDLKEDLASLNYGRLVLLLQGCKVDNQTEGCYTGGFIRDLSAPGRIIITPCNETGESYGYHLFPGEGWSHVGYFSRAFINALNPENAAFAQADVNGDGIVSMLEAFQYAWQNDEARIDGRETPQLDDNGDGLAGAGNGWLSWRTHFGSYNLDTTDLNHDGIVNILDLRILGNAWQTMPAGPWDSSWPWCADMNADNLITIADAGVVTKDWMKTFSGTGGTGTPTGTPHVSLYPNEIEATKYQTFSVDVTITDVTDLACYQFYIYYNTAVLSCTGADLPSGHFLTPVIDPSYIFVIKGYNNSYNATHGRVWVGATLMADEPGKNGGGTLATINFEALAVGSSTLRFHHTVLGDSAAEAMPVITVDGSVTVLPTLTVLAQDQYGSSLTTGDVYIDDEWRGVTGSTFTVAAGTHTVFRSLDRNDFWEAGLTGYRYGFQQWENGSTENPRTITIDEAKTITASFYKKWCPGDVNGDGRVRSNDIILIGKALFSHRGEPNWDSRCDLNCDGRVRSADIIILGWYIGNTYPDP